MKLATVCIFSVFLMTCDDDDPVISDEQMGVSCPDPQVECDGGCFDLATTPTHCGACSATCSAGEACEGGLCTLQCGGDTPTRCDNSCVDLDTNEEFCGECSTSCSAGDTCTNGTCTAPV